MDRRVTLSLLALIIAFQLGLSVVRVFQVPVWAGYHHEVDIYRVVRFIVDNGRFPTESDYPPGQFAVRQGSQPPLYTALALPLVAAYDDGMSLDLRANPTPYCLASGDRMLNYELNQHYNLPYSGTVKAAYAVRILGALLLAGAVVLTYYTGQVLFPQRPVIGLIAAGVLAFEPNHIWIGSTITNDSLLLLLAAANLFFAARVLRADDFGTRRDVLLLVITAALAVFTKLSGWLLLLLTILLLALKVARLLWTHFNWRYLLISVGVLLVPLLLGGLMAAYNVAHFGTPLGRYSHLNAVIMDIIGGLPRLPRTVLPMLDYTLNDYTARLADAELPGRLIDLYTLGTLLALATIPVAAVKQVWGRQWRDVATLGWLAVVVAAGVSLVLMRNHAPQTGDVFYSHLLYAPVRYYATMTPALVLLMSFGLYALLPRQVAQWHPVGAVAALSWLGVMVLIVSRDPTATLLHQSVISQHTFITQTYDDSMVHQGDSAFLVGHLPPTVTETGQVQVDVYASTIVPVSENFVGHVTLTDANGKQTICEFVPVHGLYPTTRWEPNQVIHHTQQVHNCTQPLTAPIEVHLQWANASYHSRPALLGVMRDDIGISDDCPPNYGVIGDELQITSVRMADEIRTGQTFEPYLDYVALNVPFTAESRVFSIVHKATNETYQCRDLLNIDGRTITFAESRASTARGETIYMDSCAVYVPKDAPHGTYDVYVQFTGTDGAPMPIQLPDGEQRHALRFGSVTVR